MGFRSLGVIALLLATAATQAACSREYDINISMLGYYRPGLVARGASCALCHARIEGNIVTDFGHGDPWFLGNNSAGIGSGFYGNPAYKDQGAWQSIDSLTGRVIYPNVMLNRTEHSKILDSAGIPAGVTEYRLRDLLTKNPYHSDPVPHPKADQTEPAIEALDTSQPMIEASKLVAVKSVTIRAPTDAEITELPIGASSPERLRGFVDQGTFILATGETYCSGAHKMVDKPLLFMNAQIHTSSEGCRLYSNRNIFIVGELPVVGPSRLRHVQLSTSRAIFAGFDQTSLTTRFIEGGKAGLFNQGYTRSMPPVRLLEEGATFRVADRYIPTFIANDVAAFITANPSYLTPGSVQVSSSSPVSYSRMVWNAAEVNILYEGGAFEGVIITEIITGPKGTITFRYDDTFSSKKIKLLPEMDGSAGGPVFKIFN